MEGGANKDPVREENVGNRMLIGMSYDLIQVVATINTAKIIIFM
jgi:hypothetical protein